MHKVYKDLDLVRGLVKMSNESEKDITASERANCEFELSCDSDRRTQKRRLDLESAWLIYSNQEFILV